ncbi:MAG: hypothetical protein IT426_09870 [Pirellulales bacterium]|nr:hypothetical protein [Pirellulales bacterium]
MAKKKRPADERNERDAFSLDALPDRRAMEKILRELTDDLVGGRRKDTPLDRAQELMYQAFEASPAKRIRLARKALTISPDCADAYVLLAENAGTAGEAQELYEQGVAAGERAIGKKGFKEHAGHFWGVLETRPYMRARQGLAQCLWVAGRREEAAEHYREMLRLNPNDNQGVRYSLATVLLDLGLDGELRELYAQYEDDSAAEWAYGTALLAFRESGESKRAGELLKKARKANKHVPKYLLGHKQLPPEPPPYITMGGEDEAVSYVGGNRRAWMNTPGAISWMRQSLDLPLPPPPKRRRLSWPELKLILLRCPQERGEAWQVDVVPFPIPAQSGSGTDSPWVVMVVGRAGQELLAMEPFEDRPKPGDLWDFLADLIRKPGDSESRRPAAIEVRQQAFHAAWKAKLKQIGVECVISETLDALDWVRDHLPPANFGFAPEEGDAPADPEELLSLPFEPGEIWQADIRPMPAWITGEGAPYRPWMSLVINRTGDLMLAHQMTPDRPDAELLWSTVAQAIRQPAIGEPHRPGAIEVNSAEHRDALLPRLDPLGVECMVLERLEHLDSAVEDMMRHLDGGGGPPSIVDSPGMKPAQVGGFYAAVAEYYRRKPWQRVPGDSIVKIECDKFQSGPWYAVVMGQSGVEQGLAIYEDLAALQRLISGRASEAEHARGMSGLSLMFCEAFEVSTRDIDAAEKHGWPLAGPEAYPLVIRVNPGPSVRAPLTWELELLEGCLRTIPDFLAEKQSAEPMNCTTDALALRLSWVPAESKRRFFR